MIRMMYYRDQKNQRVLEFDVDGLEITAIQGDPLKGFFLIIGAECFQTDQFTDPFPVCLSMLNKAFLTNYSAKDRVMKRLREFFEVEDRAKFLGGL